MSCRKKIGWRGPFRPAESAAESGAGDRTHHRAARTAERAADDAAGDSASACAYYRAACLMRAGGRGATGQSEADEADASQIQNFHVRISIGGSGASARRTHR